MRPRAGQGDGPAQPGAAAPRLGRNVIALSVVSFFTDVSSEMIYPLLPVFLSSVLGASAGFIGVIEGAAESTASLLKLASGWWSDRVRRRKPLVVAGYALASLTRPLVAIAQSAGQVLAIRVTDRVGKGIRSSPRDALIADSVDHSIRGRAFGFHRAADHLGAVVGPLLAYGVLRWWGGASLRGVFWLAAIPGAIAVAVLLFAVKERERGDRGTGALETARGAPPKTTIARRRLTPVTQTPPAASMRRSADDSGPFSPSCSSSPSAIRPTPFSSCAPRSWAFPSCWCPSSGRCCTS